VIKWILVVLAVLLIAAMIVPRVMPQDAARWHVDPTTAQPADKPNSYLIADYDAVALPLSPAEAMARFDRVAMAEPRVSRLAQDDGLATYVQRSALFGFPDYISVSARADGDGSRVSIYSRSRFGHSDLGVNKARIEQWLKKIESNADE